MRGPTQMDRCATAAACRAFLSSLQLDAAYFEPQYDRCYCADCGSRIPALLEMNDEHREGYEVPHGWCGFGLQVPARGKALKAFERWAASYHGLAPRVLPSVLAEGQLLMPGDALLDGSTLPNRATRAADRISIYTRSLRASHTRDRAS